MPPEEPDRSHAHGGDDWDLAPAGLLVLDEKDRVRSANARFLTLIGAAWDDVAGKAFWTELVSAGTRVVYLTQLAPVLELDGAVYEVMVDLRTKDGVVPALLNAHRNIDAAGRRGGTRIALIRVQDRRRYEDELRRARFEAERAREETEQARRADAEVRRRMEFLAKASAALAGSREVSAVLDALAQVVVEDFADWCVVLTRDAAGPEAVQWSAAHRDPHRVAMLEQVAAVLPDVVSPRSALRQALEGGVPVLLDDAGEDHLRRAVDDETVRAQLLALGFGSALLVPSYARAEQMAGLVVVRDAARPPFSNDDLADLTDVAARTGLVIDNLRRSAREHSNSVTLQRAVLTVPPVTPGVQIATRYLPATSGNDIGGDWYDAFLQPDGTLVLVVGDVVGHDIRAAAAMGQLRGLIRAVGYITGDQPSEILSRADEASRGLGVQVLASVLVGCLRTTGDTALLQWSNAGHPPPVVVTENGARLLEVVPDRPLGLGARLVRPRTDHDVVLRPGDVWLLYTDGVVERPDESYDTGLARLRATLDGTHGLDLEDLCDLVLAKHAAGTRDDIALLAVRVGA